MITSTTKTIAAAFAVAAAIGATTAQAATAKHGNGVRIAGTCSDSSTSKIKVKRDDGRLKVEFEVDQNRNGVPWNVEFRKDGKLVFQGTRLTKAPSGSFSLERRIPGVAKGLIQASATRNGETCTAIVPSAKVPAATASAATVKATTTVSDDGPGHDVGDDKGGQANDDGPGHDVGDDNGGHHGNDD